MAYYDAVDLSHLVGQTFTKIEPKLSAGEIFFYIGDKKYCMFHQQDCCENVNVEEVEGDYQNIVGTPLISATVDVSDSTDGPGAYESSTRSVYVFSTQKGTVTIKWLGTSNGYYSETVNFYEV